jgi:hypothetical protein
MANDKTAPQEFLDQQVKLLQAGDTAGLAARYAEDAIFVRFDRIARGRDEIRKLFDDHRRYDPVSGRRATRSTAHHRSRYVGIQKQLGLATDCGICRASSDGIKLHAAPRSRKAMPWRHGRLT